MPLRLAELAVRFGCELQGDPDALVERVAPLQEVQTYAKTAGLDVVVSEALYASPSVDVTQQVLSALQARKGAPAKP